MSNTLKWSHNKVLINDIRKVKNFYILSIDEVENSIFVEKTIFESRVNSYYLRDNSASISRNEVLNMKWNMLITKGFFYKVERDTKPEQIWRDADKYYISFLEIDGPLGMYIPQ
jgi:hypothetical protein